MRDPVDALSLCDELGVLAAVLPEVDALHDVEQSAFHHLDVFDHTLHVIDAAADVAANVAHFFPDPRSRRPSRPRSRRRSTARWTCARASAGAACCTTSRSRTPAP